MVVFLVFAFGLILVAGQGFEEVLRCFWWLWVITGLTLHLLIYYLHQYSSCLMAPVRRTCGLRSATLVLANWWQSCVGCVDFSQCRSNYGLAFITVEYFQIPRLIDCLFPVLKPQTQKNQCEPFSCAAAAVLQMPNNNNNLSLCTWLVRGKLNR